MDKSLSICLSIYLGSSVESKIKMQRPRPGLQFVRLQGSQYCPSVATRDNNV